MNLMARRRALMGGKKSITPVYSIKNRDCQAGTSISTVPFLSADLNATFLLDIDIISLPTSGYGSTWRVAIWDHSRFEIGYGLGSSSDQSLSVIWQGSSWNKVADMSKEPGRIKMAIVHEANSKNARFLYKRASGSIVEKGITKDTFAITNRPLLIGSAANNAQSLPPSKINSCEIYYAILSENDIQAFMNGGWL